MSKWQALSIDARCAEIIRVHPQTAGTAKAIAAALSRYHGETISRNAVVAYYYRHGAKLVSVPLSGIKPAMTPNTEKPEPKKTPALPKLVIKRPSMLLVGSGMHFSSPKPVKPAAITAPVAAVTAPVPVPEPFNRKLFELDSRECRWPVSGDREQMLFCGHPTELESPYCQCHKAISAGAGSRAERTAVPKRYLA